jgi:3-oxoacyl-[acyl-carrier protein] reductase
MRTYAKKDVAVISGGFGLLGLEIGRALARADFSVVLLYHATPKEGVEEIIGSLAPLDISAVQLDLENSEEVKRVVGAIEDGVGAIYAAVHCAQSRIVRKKIGTLEPRQFMDQFTVPVLGGFNFFREIALYMQKRRRGVLVGVTTAAIEKDDPVGNVGGYIAAKSALKGMLKEFSAENSPFGIRTHVIAPAFMAGGLNADLPERLIEFMRERSGGSMLSPDDVARKVAELILANDTVNTPLTLLVER